MGSKEWHSRENSTDRKGQKRKLDQNHEEIETAIIGEALRREVAAQVQILTADLSWSEPDRAAAKRATHLLAELAKNGIILSMILRFFY